METVLPIEVEILSLRVLREVKLEEAEGALCREKGILKRSLDTRRNGWERVLQSYQCQYNQEVLHLK